MLNADAVTDTGCKGCKATVRLSDDEMAVLQRLALQDKELVTEEEFERRLELCHSCPALQYGTTCRYCGCLVQIKVKLEHSRCPSPSGGRW